MSYTKLFRSIIHSTVWREPSHVKVVWVTLLAMADQDGVAETSIPGLADAARVTLEQATEALERLQAPDRYSRSKTLEGRRIVAVDGGFELVNHGKYRELMSKEDRLKRAAARQKRWRERNASRNASLRDVDGVTTSDAEASQMQNRPDKTPLSVSHSPRRRRWTRIPATWQPNPSHTALAQKLGVDIEHELELIRDHEYKTPKSDPDAAFRTWLRNAKRFALPNAARDNTTPRELFERAERLRAQEAAE